MHFPRALLILLVITGLTVPQYAMAGKLGGTPVTEIQNPWTTEDIKTLCENRWKNQHSAIQGCIERNQRNLGKEKSPGEIQELESLKPYALTNPQTHKKIE